MDKQEIEFLKESNAIEREYSEEALEDAIESWDYAKVFIPSGRKIDIPMVKTVHEFLMKRLDLRIAGNIREVDVWVGGRKCLEPKYIEKELRFILGVSPSTEQGIKEWHILFEKIHPFEDGNGRTGRIIMNLQRLKIGLPISIIHEGKEQQEYYKWFRNQEKNQIKCNSCLKQRQEYVPGLCRECADKMDNHIVSQEKKGCGKEFMWISALNDKRICGQMEDLKHSDHIILCPECRNQEKNVTEDKNGK